MIRRNILRSLVAMAALTALGGCGGSPLIGRWSRTQGTGTLQQKFTLSFNADGTVGGTVAGMGDCSGAIDITGARWTATASQVTTTGTTQCSGSITCMSMGQSVTIDCSTANTQPTGMAENFSISGNTLTLAGSMYTRE